MRVSKNFEILPKLFSGRQITIEFPLSGFGLLFLRTRRASFGARRDGRSNVTLDTGETYYVYGERDIALALLQVPKSALVKHGVRDMHTSYVD